ncbi:MAG: hypothetical protein QXO75_05240 [Nitrososphaerota archaeon]
MKQDITYLGKEVKKNGKKVIRRQNDRNYVRKVLESAAYIMYYTTYRHRGERQGDKGRSGTRGGEGPIHRLID